MASTMVRKLVSELVVAADRFCKPILQALFDVVINDGLLAPKGGMIRTPPMPTASVLLRSSVKYGQGSEEHDLSGIANAMGSIPRPPPKKR